MSKLLPGENVVLKEHPHWITLVRSLLLPAALVVLVALADLTVLGPKMLYVQHLRTYLTLGVVALALLWAIVSWIGWQSIVYTLTDQRITIERGVFSRQEKTIPIDRVQDCATRQTILGRIFGYGHVEVDAAGVQGADVFEYLPRPGDFRDQVFVQSERRRGGGAVAAPAPATSGV